MERTLLLSLLQPGFFCCPLFLICLSSIIAQRRNCLLYRPGTHVFAICLINTAAATRTLVFLWVCQPLTGQDMIMQYPTGDSNSLTQWLSFMSLWPCWPSQLIVLPVLPKNQERRTKSLHRKWNMQFSNKQAHTLHALLPFFCVRMQSFTINFFGS